MACLHHHINKQCSSSLNTTPTLGGHRPPAALAATGPAHCTLRFALNLPLHAQEFLGLCPAAARLWWRTAFSDASTTVFLGESLLLLRLLHLSTDSAPGAGDCSLAPDPSPPPHDRP